MGLASAPWAGGHGSLAHCTPDGDRLVAPLGSGPAGTAPSRARSAAQAEPHPRRARIRTRTDFGSVRAAAAPTNIRKQKPPPEAHSAICHGTQPRTPAHRGRLPGRAPMPTGPVTPAHAVSTASARTGQQPHPSWLLSYACPAPCPAPYPALYPRASSQPVPTAVGIPPTVPQWRVGHFARAGAPDARASCSDCRGPAPVALGQRRTEC